jgi:S-adenosylmethionine/arginine decarboxylase-like enzyme
VINELSVPDQGTARTREPFGWMLIMDLVDCDPDTISSGDHIRNYATTLCDDILRMNRYGPMLVEHFGHADPKTAGYTLYQMIETSNIGGHFSEDRGTAHLDVFSCRWYDPDQVLAFTLDHFRASLGHQTFIQRG